MNFYIIITILLINLNITLTCNHTYSISSNKCVFAINETNENLILNKAWVEDELNNTIPINLIENIDKINNNKIKYNIICSNNIFDLNKILDAANCTIKNNIQYKTCIKNKHKYMCNIKKGNKNFNKDNKINNINILLLFIFSIGILLILSFIAIYDIYFNKNLNNYIKK
jgi:hypothetical protein